MQSPALAPRPARALTAPTALALEPVGLTTALRVVGSTTALAAVLGLVMDPDSDRVAGLGLDLVTAAVSDRATGPALADRRPARLVLPRRPPTHPSRFIEESDLQTPWRFGGLSIRRSWYPTSREKRARCGAPKNWWVTTDSKRYQ